MESRGNPNPQAKIAFVIYYPFQFYVYKNVYSHLKDEAEFVIDLGAFFPTRQNEDILPATEALLEKHGARYRVLQHEDYYYPRFLERFLAPYDVLISVWQRGCLNTEAAQAKKLVHMTYGVGKELTTFDLRKVKFDLILAYGEYDHAFYSLLSNSIVAGNPKFDDWFTNTVDTEAVSNMTARLDRSKKTVLYLPTHSDLCSIKDLAGDLKKITDEYNVIVKLHYYTPREEPELVELLKNPRIVLLQDDTDLLPLLKLADVVVSDNSSVIFDAMLANKPVIVTDFHSTEYLDAEHKSIRMYRRGQASALTYSNSIEQRIKRDGTVDTIAKPEELRMRIAEVLARDDKRERRVALAAQLFSYRDGQSGKRAVDAIRELIKNGPKERPFLYHALEHYTTNVLRRPWRGALQNSDARHLIEGSEGRHFFSVIWLEQLHTERDAAYLSLRSLAELQYPPEDFEIIVVGKNAKEYAKKFPDTVLSEPRPRVVCISGDPEHALGAQVSKAIQAAKGDILCFTTSGCRVSSDWLTSLYLAYERHPDSGGVGGYVWADKERYTLFDEALYYEFGKRFGAERESLFLSRLYEIENQLLYQNPAGDLSNMSYRKELVPPDLSHARTLRALGLYLKVSAMSERPLSFIPNAVTRLTRMNVRQFARMHYESGFLNRAARDLISARHRYKSQSLAAAVADSARAALRYKDLRHGALIFLASTARWVGKVGAAASLLVRRAENMFRDVQKTKYLEKASKSQLSNDVRRGG